MTGVRAVLFDAGNTLVFLDQVRLSALYRQAGFEIPLDRIRTAEWEGRRRLQLRVRTGHEGTEPEVWREYFEVIFRASGIPEEALPEVGERLRDTHAGDHLWTQVEPGTSAALEALASRGIRLGVISNADGRMEAVIERCGLRSHFDFVIDSEVVGVAKPDPKIFRAGHEAMGLQADECLYVGDLYPVDYVGATEAGLHALLIDPLGVNADRAPVIERLGDLEFRFG